MGTNPALATEFNDLQDEVIRLVNAPQVNEFALAKLLKKVDALAKSDACGRFELRSAIAARLGHSGESNEYFQKAIACSDNKVDTVIRAMSFQQRTGNHARVAELFDQYYELLRNDPAGVKHSRVALSMSGLLVRANRLIDDFRRLSLQVPDFSPLVAEVIENSDATEDGISEVVAYCKAFLRSRGTPSDGQWSNYIPPLEGHAGVLITFRIDGEPEQLAEAEWDLLEHVAARSFPELESGFLSVGLTTRSLDACQ